MVRAARTLYSGTRLQSFLSRDSRLPSIPRTDGDGTLPLRDHATEADAMRGSPGVDITHIVSLGQNVILITDANTFIGLPARDIPVFGRNPQGARLVIFASANGWCTWSRRPRRRRSDITRPAPASGRAPRPGRRWLMAHDGGGYGR